MPNGAEPHEGRAPPGAGRQLAATDELHLYFPIEVEVRTVETVQDLDAAAERAVGKLTSLLRGAA
jgi:hypothetical protein